MDNKLFNDFTLSNEEIEKILVKFNSEIKKAVKNISGIQNLDYEQIIRMQIFKTLSKNTKK